MPTVGPTQAAAVRIDAMKYLRLHDAGVARLVDAVEQTGLPQPFRRFRVPVVTRPAHVEYAPITTMGDAHAVYESVRVQETVRTVDFDRVSVSVADEIAAQTQSTGPTLAATLAAHHGTLLTTQPITTHRHTESFYTTYDFYVAAGDNATTLENIACEHAYAVYATGAGNVLGTYTALTGTTAGTVRLQYQWFDGSAQNGATPATVQAALNATNYRYYAPPPPTTEQLAQAAARKVQFERVVHRAEKLLLAHLSEAQRKTWVPDNYVLVTTPRGRTYRVERGTHLNVYLVNPHGTKLRKYCAYANDPGGSLPAADQVFAQVVTLQFNEREFLAAANTWDLTRENTPFVGKGCDADADIPALVAA